MRLLPGVCSTCGRSVAWNGHWWRDPRPKGGRHRCPEDRPACNALMIYGQRCARKPGHTTEHRTAYALANARAARTGRRAA